MAKKTHASVPGGDKSTRLLRVAVIMLAYGIAAAILYAPLRATIHGPQRLMPISSVLAATGCFLLSRRWVPLTDASFLSGLFYGFGPFLLSFAGFHPLAGLGMALVPWLFCPAALWHKYESSGPGRSLLRGVLLILPLAFLFLYFWLPAQKFVGPYFLMPQGAPVPLSDLFALMGVFHPHSGHVITGFYSAALILALLGAAVFVQTARIAVFAPVLAGVILTFWESLGHVNPAVWFSLPALFLAVSAGLGASTVTLFGASDRRWILASLAAAGLLAAWTAMGAFRNKGLYLQPALMFALTAAVLAVCLILAQLPFRTVWMRRLLIWALAAFNLCAALRTLY